MISKISEVCKAVEQMNTHLRNDLLKNDESNRQKMLWENTFIRHQIEKRQKGEPFTINDHIRAMVYSMLSSGASWKRVLDYTDLETGKIAVVDEIFCSYEPGELLKAHWENWSKSLKEKSLASQYTNKQMKVLKENIETLQKIQQEHGAIDNYYSQVIKENGVKKLVSELSSSGKPYKMRQLGFPLACEYLKNVGYDLSKPDRHIRRILGKDYLNLSEKQPVPEKQALDIVSELAKELNKPVAEVDYILWSYCANGYGQICTKNKNKSKCGECVAKEYCNHK